MFLHDRGFALENSVRLVICTRLGPSANLSLVDLVWEWRDFGHLIVVRERTSFSSVHLWWAALSPINNLLLMLLQVTNSQWVTHRKVPLSAGGDSFIKSTLVREGKRWGESGVKKQNSLYKYTNYQNLKLKKMFSTFISNKNKQTIDQNKKAKLT